MAQSTPRELSHGDSSDDLNDTVFHKRGCCTFLNFPCFSSDVWDRISTSDQQQESNKESWWDKGINKLKKVREWSELVAGPKWKTFIRRFNKTAGRPKFQYDPLSYARNFDEGPGQNGQFDDAGVSETSHHAMRRSPRGRTVR